MNFSIEISPSTDLDTLPALKDVYITLLPGGDFRDTADQAEKLVKKGFNPIPHIPARSIESEAQLKEYVSRCKDGGTKQVLVIGGSREPIGQFDSSFQLLETGYFEDMKIGIAGHPEGSPDISDSNLKKWINEIKDLSKNYFKSKKIAVDVLNGPAVSELNKEGITVVDAKLILEQARVIKSPEELKCMKSAIDVAEIGVRKMREELKPGMTEDELWSILHKTNIEYGGEWIECRILSSGERTNPWMQESSNKVMQNGEIVAFDTDMVGPYGYCADISRTFVVGHKFNDNQKKLYSMAMSQIDHNSRLIKSGMSFKEFVSKSWVLPDEYYGNRYSCMVHGIGLCDEWPQIRYPTDGGEQGGSFEKNMTITLESYIGKVGGKEGVKLEQQYLIGENGLELISHHPLENI